MGHAKKARPLIGFNIQWIFEEKHWDPRTLYLRTKKGIPMAWFNLLERTWEITYTN